MKTKEIILVIGACGQIGRELTSALRKKYGTDSVFATDIAAPETVPASMEPYQKLNVMDTVALESLMESKAFTQVYHLAAVLSANGERNPKAAWDLNMNSLLNVLDLSVKYKVSKVFWPSSIAVFGPNSQKLNTPQYGVMEPTTIYGLSKAAGELWCKYYFEKYGLDVRSLRYPGLISAGEPGGGTTDYAVDIFHSAVKAQVYTCFLKEDTGLPMMYMPDAIRATLELMNAPVVNMSVRTAYNIGALSFTPEEIYSEIVKQMPDFKIAYQPDFRQEIADSWPQSIDDSTARKDWGWKPDYDLQSMVEDMLENIKKLSGADCGQTSGTAVLV
ncbi:NAD-dependent epimerase/dehydratase family protein [Pedobacter sp. MC2016-24]|uniref:NAD-dependent epimerase/dehydratase family protein n=1 Tax=Pedobacter sp. MC2016-24 TaxID=2780090 RepID=UPI00187DDFD7|nr:NAD-dependent epimerase/dehydratase family protein [Pedobacter sp. MC2016-24]MBE9598244.1 NAD-dependent epimerase/dehydratase family protein [Pedobacter sp. MC2016-24]